MLGNNSWFTSFAQGVAHVTGRPLTFLAAVVLIVGWAVSGPLFGFSDTWQLVINTGTTIATFLMVFLIQNSQTRDSEAIHVKLDELIESTKGARRELLDLEELPEEELHRLQEGYEALAAEARREHHGRVRGRRSVRPTPGEGAHADAARKREPARKAELGRKRTARKPGRNGKEKAKP